MARAKATGNGNGPLEAAVRDMLKAQAGLVQAHATLAQTQAAIQAQMVESERLRAESDQRRAEAERRFDEFLRRFNEYERQTAERFARIEAILLQHSAILERLPDAVRERMGFPIPERQESPQ